MSVKWTWQQAILESELPSTVKLVLLALGCHMSQMGESCYPSMRLLAKECSLSLPSVCKQIALAAERGWLRIDQHGLKGQKWRRNEYFPAWPQGVQPGLTALPKVLTLATEGVKPDSKKVLNDVERNISLSLSKREDAQARATEGAALARKSKAGDELIDAKSLGDLAKMLTRGVA